MFRTIACCSVPIFLLVLFSYSPLQQPELPVIHAADTAKTSDASGNSKDTVDYFTLKRHLIRAPRYKASDSNLVITGSDDLPEALQAISRQEVIDLPSQQVLDSMDYAYFKAQNRRGKEQFFFVGRKGMVSIIVEGKDTIVDSIAKAQAFFDLTDQKNDFPAYSVHTHWKHPVRNDPEYKACPSIGINADTDPANFGDQSRVFIILGYEREDSVGVTPCVAHPTDKIKKKVKYIKTICFYNTKGDIKRIKYSDFQSLINNIRQNK